MKRRMTDWYEDPLDRRPEPERWYQPPAPPVDRGRPPWTPVLFCLGLIALGFGLRFWPPMKAAAEQRLDAESRPERATPDVRLEELVDAVATYEAEHGRFPERLDGTGVAYRTTCPPARDGDACEGHEHHCAVFATSVDRVTLRATADARVR